MTRDRALFESDQEQSQTLNWALNGYRNAVKQGVVAAGDYVDKLTDVECKHVYDLAINDSFLKNRLIKSLWFNYKTQKFRWENATKGLVFTPNKKGGE